MTALPETADQVREWSFTGLDYAPTVGMRLYMLLGAIAYVVKSCIDTFSKTLVFGSACLANTNLYF